MPTGFKVETGSNLSPKLLDFVDRFWDHLKELRQPGTYPKPVTADELCGWAASTWDFVLAGPDVRAMVNYLRRQGKPVASADDGYFVAESRSELDSTVRHMSERIEAMRATRDGMLKKFEDGNQRTFL